jgi:hypothetical protein
MRKNYNFNINQPQPDTHEIRKHQNFDSLLQAFEEQKGNAPRSARIRPMRLVYAAVATAAATLAVVWFFRVRSSDYMPAMDELVATSEAYFTSQPVVQPPFPNLVPPPAEHILQADRGGKVELKNGGYLQVPAAAFVDASGRPVTGAVSIQYRTFHDQADLLLSGIPQNYDSAGVRLQLSSSGMIEVSATQNGQPVALGPDQTLEVAIEQKRFQGALDQLPSPRVLYLAADEKSWRNGLARNYEHSEAEMDRAASDPAFVTQQAFRQKKTQLEQQLALQKQELLAGQDLPPKPEAPSLDAGNRASFDLELDENAGVTLKGELAQADPKVLEQKTWIVSEKSADFDLRALTVVWESIEVEKLTQREYQITFRSGSSSDRVIVEPLLSPAEYQDALTAYQERLAEWEAQRASLEANIADEVAYLEDTFQEKLQKARNEYQQSLDSLGLDAAEEGTLVLHTFQIPKLGIWNVVQPFRADDQLIVASLENPTGDQLSDRVAYLVDRSMNTVYRFYAAPEGSLMQFEQLAGSDFVLAIRNNDNELATLDGADLQAFLRGDGDSRKTLVLANSQPVASLEDVRAMLSI